MTATRIRLSNREIIRLSKWIDARPEEAKVAPVEVLAAKAAADLGFEIRPKAMKSAIEDCGYQRADTGRARAVSGSAADIAILANYIADLFHKSGGNVPAEINRIASTLPLA